MFGLLYLAQGAIMSYFTAFNGLYLHVHHEIPLDQAGLIGTIGMIPFVLKIFLGMLSDGVNLLGLGHRRPYIVLGLLLQAGCLFLVPYIHPATQWGLFAVLAFFALTGMALYDTCTDGMALDTTPPEDEALVQSIMVGGRALGVVVTSAVLGWLADWAGWLIGPVGPSSFGRWRASHWCPCRLCWSPSSRPGRQASVLSGRPFAPWASPASSPWPFSACSTRSSPTAPTRS
jgi:PAT family beta-lactamase induction signal transducer AmpG